MAERSLADDLFRPRAVALVGASGDETKNTARPQRYLQRHGFAGRIVPINRGRDRVLGEPAFPTAAAAPGPIDHAFIMVPAAAVPAAVEDCCRAGVRVATIFSDGFAETGADGLRTQRTLVESARRGGLRLVGPNSMGVVDVHARAPITVSAVFETPTLTPGPIGVVSQSGTVLGALLSRGQARGLGFSKLVSIGNEADLGIADIGDMLIDDAETRAIVLFLETMRDPAALSAMARRAFAAGKPVIAYRLGRSEAGRALALSHSGAIAGDDAAADAFFGHHGIVRVDMLETLLEMPPLLMGRQPRAGRRVAVLTTTGGGAAMVVDRLGAAGVTPIPAPQAVRDALRPFGIRLGHGPLIDVTMAGARGEVYRSALEALLGSPDCDAVVAVVGSSAQFHPEVAVAPIAAAASAAPSKPLAAFLVPQADESLAMLARAGIAAFRTPEACADAIRACLAWSAPAPVPPSEHGALAHVVSALRAARGPVLNEWTARPVFEALGIPQAAAHLLDETNPVSEIGYPVVVKVLSPDIPHKTEAGGVVVGVCDDGSLQAAAAEIRMRIAERHPDVRVSDLLVQRMESGVGEVLIGYRDAPGTGPVVILGVGGVIAEIHRDAAVRVAPVDLETARAMVREVRELAPVRGYRGSQPGDCEALAAAVAALSSLARLPAEAPHVREAEINPIIVKPECEGVVAVDGLIVVDPAEAS